MVRFTINGVTMTGTVVGQEREISTGRWLYEIRSDGRSGPDFQTAKLHFSDFEIL